MRLISTAAALALLLGANGCMGAMDERHHAMMGGMTSHQRAETCPKAEEGAHGATQSPETSHDHSAAEAQDQCPPANAEHHQHPEPQD